ncbi:MAG: hypothetical protein WAT79_14715 [Saprospiraceae bacterium]
MKIVFLLLSFFVLCNISAQSPYLLRNSVEHNIVDRFDILQLSDTFQATSLNNFDAKETYKIFKSIWLNQPLTEKDKYNVKSFFRQYVEFLPKDMEEPMEETGLFSKHKEDILHRKELTISDFERNPILKYFYRTEGHLLSVSTPSFQLYLNPVIHFQYSNEKDNQNIIFQNTRGAEVKGYIDKKVYFFAQILENQRSFPSYVDASIDKYKALPGQGFSKSFQSSIISNLKGYDYFNARTYIGFVPTKSIQLELGHGNHFIGNGIRSMLLSDFSNPYFYLKMNTRIWKFHYQNLFSEMSPISTLIYRGGDKLLPKKYTATHYLTFRPNNHFEIGLFETVIFARENHFEFQYLNPIILYRAVEHSLGSPDNVMLGLNVKWNFLKKFSVYGQLLVDEFKADEVFKKTGWWANKFGSQLGVKYMNAFGIDQLDIQVELNSARPYTYTHRDTLPGFLDYSVANYTNHNQPLAHPLGANFKEFVGVIRFKPTDRIFLQSRFLHSVVGVDKDGLNWGQNILIPNDNRPMDFDNYIGQGLKTSIFQTSLDASYAFYHQCYIDTKVQFRQTNDINETKLFIFSLGLRINMQDIPIDY